jgi:hypothetical protein
MKGVAVLEQNHRSTDMKSAVAKNMKGVAVLEQNHRSTDMKSAVAEECEKHR